MKCIYFRNGERCEAESGSCFVCEFHRRSAAKGSLERLWEIARYLVLLLAETPWESFICYHCGEEFPREAICVDHFPRHRGGIHCVEMWDIRNMVPSCQACNTSGSPNRSRSLRRKTLRPTQQGFIDRRDALEKGIDELKGTRDGLEAKGIKLPPIHEHIEIIAKAISLNPPHPHELAQPRK